VGGRKEHFLPVTARQFRRVPEKDPLPPVPTLELLSVNTDGRFIHTEQGTMKKTPAWFAIGEILCVLFVILSILAIMVYAPFWLFGGLIKSRRRPAELTMRFWPLLAVLSLMAFVVIFITATSDLIDRLGNLTFWSASLWAVTLVFAHAALASFFVALRRPEEGVRRGVRRFSLIVSLALMDRNGVFGLLGIIGVRTWA
jgi:hypothetical protein